MEGTTHVNLAIEREQTLGEELIGKELKNYNETVYTT